MRKACFVFLCLASAPTHALTQDEMREEFAVASGGTLVAKVEDGDIEIVTHDMERVVVEVFRKVRAATDDLERQVLKSHRVRISQDGSEVRIRARSWRGRDHIEVREFSVRFVVTVPQRFSARLRTSDGDIHVRGLEGALEARSTDGSFRLEGLRGRIRVETSDGDIEVADSSGDMELETSDGNIRIDAFDGPIWAETSDGDITVVLSAPSEDCDLQTADGDVDIRIDATAALTLDFRVADGDIDVGLPIRGRIRRDSLRGDLNGGGSTLSVRTFDGDIRLRPTAKE